MRIGLDLRYVYPHHVHGIGRYSLELARAMVRRAPEHEWVAFVRRNFGGSVTGLAGVEEVGCPEPPISLGTWLRMAKRIHAHRLDVFHAMFPVLPRRLKDVRTVVTFYDLQAVKVWGFSGARNPIVRAGACAFYRVAYRHAYRNADRVLTISEATARELTSFYGPRHVAVAYPGLPGEVNDTSPSAIAWLPRHYGFQGPFLLYVGNYRPHKNVKGLLHAYAGYRKQAGPHALPLVMVGIRDRFFTRCLRLMEDLGLTLYVRRVGFVPDRDLALFYRSASVLVNLSLCEGFGLPVLEAMAQGTAVVVANRLGLPELVGEAGVVVEPDDPTEVAGALATLAHDEEQNRRYGEAGRERARKFTWHAAAEVTLSTYEELNAGASEPHRLAG